MFDMMLVLCVKVSTWKLIGGNTGVNATWGYEDRMFERIGRKVSTTEIVSSYW
jgi:hypothetical protein